VFSEEGLEIGSRVVSQELAKLGCPDFDVVEACRFRHTKIGDQVGPHSCSAVECKFHDYKTQFL
jgi:hypothetical protein